MKRHLCQSPEEYGSEPLRFSQWNKLGPKGAGVYELESGTLDQKIVEGDNTRPVRVQDVVSLINYSTFKFTGKVYLVPPEKVGQTNPETLRAEDLLNKKCSFVLHAGQNEIAQELVGITFMVSVIVTRNISNCTKGERIQSKTFILSQPSNGLTVEATADFDSEGEISVEFEESSNVVPGRVRIVDSIKNQRYTVSYKIIRCHTALSLEYTKLSPVSNVAEVKLPMDYVILFNDHKSTGGTQEQEYYKDVIRFNRNQFVAIFVGSSPGTFDIRVLDKTVYKACKRMD